MTEQPREAVGEDKDQSVLSLVLQDYLKDLGWSFRHLVSLCDNHVQREAASGKTFTTHAANKIAWQIMSGYMNLIKAKQLPKKEAPHFDTILDRVFSASGRGAKKEDRLIEKITHRKYMRVGYIPWEGAQIDPLKDDSLMGPAADTMYTIAALLAVQSKNHIFSSPTEAHEALLTNGIDVIAPFPYAGGHVASHSPLTIATKVLRTPQMQESVARHQSLLGLENLQTAIIAKRFEKRFLDILNFSIDHIHENTKTNA